MSSSLKRKDNYDWAVGGRVSFATIQLEPSRLFPAPAAHHCPLRGLQFGRREKSDPQFVHHHLTNQAEGEKCFRLQLRFHRTDHSALHKFTSLTGCTLPGSINFGRVWGITNLRYHRNEVEWCFCCREDTKDGSSPVTSW
jgi:hypothetical protein